MSQESMTYLPVSTKEDGSLPEVRRRPMCPGLKLAFRILLGIIVLLFGILSLNTAQRYAISVRPRTPSLPLPRRLQQTWAQYSSYFPVEPYQPPPDGCVVSQVNLLHRHGARYPTSSSAKKIQKALKRLQKAKKYKVKNMKFLRKYKYDLGKADLLPFGAAQSFDAGHLHYERYAHLINEDQLPFVRASGSDRVILSALNWTVGFASASNGIYKPELSVILSESLNDTLDDGMCPNDDKSDAEASEWRAIFAPSIAKRLNKGAPGATVKAKDIPHLMSLCAFESFAHENASPFCSLFTQNEFDSYEYYSDVSKFYGTGYGASLGRVQGVGYVNELLARLTGQPVVDHTQTNSTLDSSPETFPLNRTFYTDFSHDNQMVAIYSALGLFQQPQALDPLELVANRTWINSRLVPFAARMITEKLQCDIAGQTKDYIRILVNDAVQPLTFCGAGGDGMCELDSFVESQWYARSDGNGDWPKCFE